MLCHLTVKTMMTVRSKEQTLVTYIKNFVTRKGGIFYKNPPTSIGRPDIEIFYNGRILILETKREGAGKIGIEQARHISRLRKQKIQAHFCDSVELFKQLWNQLMEG